ncbi:MAG: hypothetical protein HGA77_00850 [Chlorobiaceae bacterium]|nr:hypothetical protein [Chlorobiaceae bacterium]
MIERDDFLEALAAVKAIQQPRVADRNYCAEIQVMTEPQQRFRQQKHHGWQKAVLKDTFSARPSDKTDRKRFKKIPVLLLITVQGDKAAVAERERSRNIALLPSLN